MKSNVAIALIVMGSLLIMTPPASDYLLQRQVTQILSMVESGNVRLEGRMSGSYRLGCWAAGVLMVVVAVAGSLGKREKETEETKA